MRAARLFVPLLGLSLAGCAGASPDLSGLVYEQTARAGARVRLGDYRTSSQALRCATISLPEVTVTRQPAHGRVSFATGPARYVPDQLGRPEDACARGAQTALIIYYHAAPGYRGLDTLAYRVRYASGETLDIGKRIVLR